MAENAENLKLKRGTVAKLARRFRLSVPHVYLVTVGQRTGRANLMAAIEKERMKQRGEQPAEAAAA